MKHAMLVLTALFFGLIFGPVAQASSADGAHIRLIHVTKSKRNFTRVILRFPLAVVYATGRSGSSQDTAGPFTTMQPTAAQRQLDIDAVYSNFGGFVRFLLGDFRFSANGVAIDPAWLDFALIDTRSDVDNPGNAGMGLMTSLAMLSLCALEFPDHALVGETMVVMALDFPGVGLSDPFQIELISTAHPARGHTIETRIGDYRRGSATELVILGPTDKPVVLAPVPAD